MILLTELDFSLPLKNPVIIFSLVLFIILFAPLLLNKLKIPHIIGLILAGVLVGPYGLNLLLRDSSIVLFGTVGLLYIMFLAALEIDLVEFKKNKNKVVVFGLSTFLIPIILGTLAGYYMLGYNILSSILLASMFSTHTLVAYPIVSRYGLSRTRAVTLTVGGTMITDILALLVLAVIAGMTKGEIDSSFWIRLTVSIILFTCIVIFIFPILAQWFFKRFDDSISQYIFVLAVVFLGAFLAEAAGIEAIIGAFLSGLALNRFIPHSSPLMNRLDFVGNAIFIPFFLIGVGMLVDINVIFKGFNSLKVAGVMITVAVASKFLAALITQKTFRMSKYERRMIFGLSNSHAAATLAVVLVGYNIIIGETETGEPLRLLNEDILNGSILMILISCIISSFMVEKSSRKLAELEEKQPDNELPEDPQRILISLAYAETVPDLVDLALMIKPKKSKAQIYALHVIDEQENAGTSQTAGKRMMDKVIKQASATDNTVIPITRFDMNISNGIIYTIKEHMITDVVIGLHRKAKPGEQFFGPVAERVLKRCPETIYIYKAKQPLNTLNRILVAVPPKAEFEPGFQHWFERLYTLSKETGMHMIMYANRESINRISNYNTSKESPLDIVFREFPDWDEFLFFTREVKQNDLFIIVFSRRGYISYIPQFEKVPHYLTRYFHDNSFIILYPEQLESELASDFEQIENTLAEPIQENLGVFYKAGKIVKSIIGRISG
jgi:Kef-type K+ transport system membrane component KefB